MPTPVDNLLARHLSLQPLFNPFSLSHPVHYISSQIPNCFAGTAVAVTAHFQGDHVLLRYDLCSHHHDLVGNQSVILASEKSQVGLLGGRGLAQPDCQDVASPRCSGHASKKIPKSNLAVWNQSRTTREVCLCSFSSEPCEPFF